MVSPVSPDLSSAPDEHPSVLTIEEAARRLRIGRSMAYGLARRYLESDEAEGLPVIRIGSRLRVPRWALDELLATGRIVRLTDEIRNEHAEHLTPISQPGGTGGQPTARASRTRPRQPSPRRRLQSLPVEQLNLLSND